MLDTIDLSRKLSKPAYRKLKEPADLKLAALQREVRQAGVPVIILFEGWSASGKGTLINELILPLDPRGFSVHTTQAPTEEEQFHPFLWRFWRNLPPGGRLAIFDRSWNRRVVNDRIEGGLKGRALEQAFEDIRCFERQLADGGCVIIKFFLHISRKEQKHRFDALQKNAATRWRIDRHDLRQHKHYAEHQAVIEELLAGTGSEYAPWTIVEAHDRHFATMKIFDTVISVLQQRLAAQTAPKPEAGAASGAAEAFRTSVLDKVDLSLSLTRAQYERRLEKAQHRLRDLEHEIYLRRIPVVIAYEGWDAAGKGGNIRRLVQNLDPRGYEVIPIAAPNVVEKSHHYLWRFWNQMPKAGHIAIFDRTWYGRVLVERVEGFCSESEWRRAYREINETEQHLVHYGTVLLKFWLQIDADEQLRRFKQRQALAYKQWKITDEDWRNRKKMPQYRVAIEEMLCRTSTPHAPWTIVESNSKWYARVKVLETVCAAIERRLD